MGLVRNMNCRGFAFLEVLIAVGIAITVAAGAAQIVEFAIHASHEARLRTTATMIAGEKMEQLRSLAWTHIRTSPPVFSMSSSDYTTNLAVSPATDDGPGLLASPAGTLDANVVNYVDYLDGDGRWLDAGSSPPAQAVFIRRWAVEPLASDRDNVLILRVAVYERGSINGRSFEAVRLATVEARK